MADHIRIRRAPGTWVVRAGGAVLGESTNALELSEGDLPPVIYFPRADIAMAFLEPSGQTTSGRHKGEARHFTIAAKSGPIENAAWSYETPEPALAEIAGHLAFDPALVTVEEV